MKISIITVCHNSVATIGETILSVSAQGYPDKEHVIVDGASTDGTLDIVRRHASVTRCLSEPDQGIYDAMNKGIAMASGDIIGFLNADDVYADDTVLAQVAAAFADPAVDACFADLVYVKQDDPSRIVRYWRSGEYSRGRFQRGWMPAHPTFFARRSVYEAFGGYDTNFPRQADFDLTMRLLEKYKLHSVYVPSVWVRMRMGGASNNSVTGVIRGNLEAYRICRKNGLGVSPLFIFIKVASRIPQFFSRPKQ
jgi:glycosyltransferase involved in cell wall biosynthesis